MDDNPLDDVDRSILHQLQLDARQTDTEIAETVDVTSTTVRNRLDKLEEMGVIRGYHPEINYEQAGYRTSGVSGSHPRQMRAHPRLRSSTRIRRRGADERLLGRIRSSSLP